LGGDVSEGKCTWLIVKAMEKADERQMEVLRESYGTEDGFRQVLEVYNEVGLLEAYKDEETLGRNELHDLTEQLNDSKVIPRHIFTVFGEVIFGRKG